MSVAISISETRIVGPSSRAADGPPIWGVVFQLNRDDGIGTAIGVTLRCDNETQARDQAISRLRGFLCEASAAAQVLTPAVSTQQPMEEEAPGPGSQEIDEHKAPAEALDEDLDAVRGEGH